MTYPTPALLGAKHYMTTLTREKLREHGLTDWDISFDGAKSRAGRCDHGRKVISFSSPVLLYSSREEQRNTVLHEVAHALLGPHEGHGEEWIALHRKLGGSGAALHRTPRGMVTHQFFVFVGECPACGHLEGLNEEPDVKNPWICTACEGEKTDRIFLWRKL